MLVNFSVFRATRQLIVLALFATACVPAMTVPTHTTAANLPTVTATATSAITLVATATDPPPTLAPPTMPPAKEIDAEDVETKDLETISNQDVRTTLETNRMKIQIGETVLTATLADNASVAALKAALAEGPITINMRDYAGMEKVGPLGMDLPRNDEQIRAEAGDLILYQGNAFVIYYAPNAWNFTRLGKVDDVTATELKEILGDGNVTVTLSLPQE